MAGVTLTQIEKPTNLGHRWRTTWTCLLDNSYTAGGYSLKATDLGFQAAIDPDFLVEVHDGSGYTYSYDYTNLKLKVFSPFVSIASVQSPSIVAQNTTEEHIQAVTGVLATDFVISVTKPTAQAGLAIGSSRVSSAGNVAITFINASGGGITPTASQTYQFLLFRPGAPEVQALTDLSAVTCRIVAYGKFRA